MTTTRLRSRLPSRLEKNALAGQFLRFAFVGAIATGVHYAILIGLVELFDIGTVVATSVGFSVGAVVSYSLNRAITFEARPTFGHGLIKFLAVVFVGLGINAGIVAGLEALGLHYMLAQMAATGIVLFWNFGMSRLLVFTAPPIG